MGSRNTQAPPASTTSANQSNQRVSQHVPAVSASARRVTFLHLIAHAVRRKHIAPGGIGPSGLARTVDVALRFLLRPFIPGMIVITGKIQPMGGAKAGSDPSPSDAEPSLR